MKRLSGILAFAVTLLSPQITQAQGIITYVSNLGQTSTGSSAVGSDSWFAAEFTTGTNTSGYVLNSVQLGMADASGNPSGFMAMLYTGVGIVSDFPGSNLGTLNGSLNPTTAGIYSFTPASSLTLSPHASYFIVLTAGTVLASGAYEWSVTSTPSPGYSSYHWGGGTVFADSSNGSSWNYTSGAYGQFAINATAIPEPGVLGLFGLGGLAFLWHRRKSKTV